MSDYDFDDELDPEDELTEALRAAGYCRCSECRHLETRTPTQLYCTAPLGQDGYQEVCPGDFCSNGEAR